MAVIMAELANEFFPSLLNKEDNPAVISAKEDAVGILVGGEIPERLGVFKVGPSPGPDGKNHSWPRETAETWA